MNMRIGLFGGTFDPIHIGHLQLADRAFVKCTLERVIFIPAASPPHKQERVITDFRHRVRMVQMALKDRENYEVTTLEGRLGTPNYTIDTLQSLKSELPKGAELFFLTGVDAFREIETWKNYSDLLSTIHFIVLQRAGYDSDSLDCFVRRLGYISDNSFWKHPQSGKKIYYLDDKVIDISSSDVRHKIKRGLSMKGFLHHEVQQYIKEKNLYGE